MFVVDVIDESNGVGGFIVCRRGSVKLEGSRSTMWKLPSFPISCFLGNLVKALVRPRAFDHNYKIL